MDYLEFQPSKKTNGLFLSRLKVVLMTLDHAVFWDRVIQPRILRMSDRADRFWSWTFFRTILVLSQQARGRQGIGLVTMLRADNGKAIPAAMSMLIDPYFDFGSAPAWSRDSAFVWFLASAPAEILVSLGVSDPPSLGRVCLDNALVYSVNAGLLGKIGLHCAAAGGQRLFDFYEDKHLIPLPKGGKLPIRRENDGRFFYTDAVSANRILSDNAQDRSGRKLRP